MAYALKFINNLNINAGTLRLEGHDINGDPIPPLNVQSNVICANLFAERAVYCLNGNITSLPFTINNMCVANTVLTGVGNLVCSWLPPTGNGGGGSGITSLNALTGAVQTFATGTSGSDFAISSVGTTHTFNIPSASATNRGLVTTGTQTLAGVKTFSSAPVISSITNTGLLTLPTVTDTLVARTTTDTLTNKTLTAPIIASIVNTGTLTLPSVTDTLVGRVTTDSLTNKTLTDNTNNIIARELWVNNGAASVSTYAASVPSAGMVLTASSGTVAAFAAPAAATTVAIDSVSTGTIYMTGVDNNSDSNQVIKVAGGLYQNTATGDVTCTGSGGLFSNNAIFAQRTTDQLHLGPYSGLHTTITSPAPAVDRVVTLHDPGANSNFVLDTGGAMTISNSATTGYVLTATSATASNWAAPSATGITTLNTLTGAVQTFATGSTGTDFAIVSTGTTHSFNIPDAGASARGVVTNGAQTLAGVKTFSSAPVISSITNTGLLTLPTTTDTLIGRATTDTLTNKTLTAPVIASIVNSGTLTLPTSTDTLVALATTDTLTNKTLTSNTNNVIARELWIGSGSGSVSCYAATAPTTGQALVATNSTTCTWQTLPDVGITSLNGLTGVTQTFATGSSGTDFNIVSTGTTHTYNIPDASATARGLITSGAQTLAGVKTFSSAPVISSITNTGLLTLPTTTDTLVGLATTDTLTNKTLTSNTNNVISRELWVNSGAASISNYASSVPIAGAFMQALTATTSSFLQMRPQNFGATFTNKASGTTTLLITDPFIQRFGPAANPQTVILPTPVVGAMFLIINNGVSTLTIQTNFPTTIGYLRQDQTSCLVMAFNTANDWRIIMYGNSFSDALFSINDDTDPTKLILFNAAGSTATATTIASSQTVARTLTLPDATDTLVAKNTTDILTNKTLTSSTNSIKVTTIAGVGTGTKYIGMFDTLGAGTQNPETYSLLSYANGSGILSGWRYTAGAATTQLTLGTTGATTISAVAAASARTITIHDAGANSNFVLNTGGALTITDTPAAAGEILVSTSTTAAVWQSPSAGPGGYTLVSASVSLTTAQIKALGTTAIQILAAPGANTAYVIVSATWAQTYVAPAYLLGSQINLKYNTTATVAMALVADAANIRTTTNFIQCSPGNAGVGGTNINEAIAVYATGANFTTGNSTAKVNCVYFTVSL